jgi:formate-dependent nitrite reductase membrane component NrfD
VLSAREALGMILGGPYTPAFWGGVVVVGILVPMLLELVDLVGFAHRLPRPLEATVRFGAPLLVLFGGYLLRWVFVHAGQDTWFV